MLTKKCLEIQSVVYMSKFTAAEIGDGQKYINDKREMMSVDIGKLQIITTDAPDIWFQFLFAGYPVFLKSGSGSSGKLPDSEPDNLLIYWSKV